MLKLSVSDKISDKLKNELFEQLSVLSGIFKLHKNFKKYQILFIYFTFILKFNEMGSKNT